MWDDANSSITFSVAKTWPWSGADLSMEIYGVKTACQKWLILVQVAFKDQKSKKGREEEEQNPIHFILQRGVLMVGHLGKQKSKPILTHPQ